jgi:hypothetical protein
MAFKLPFTSFFLGLQGENAQALKNAESVGEANRALSPVFLGAYALKN